jgi:hypothetical protein
MATKLSIAGNTFLFTGKLTEFTREEAEAHVEAEGGKVLSGVSAKLNYLVVGEDAGSKLAKAEALGTVTILHEKEFLKMMQTGKKAPTKKTNKVEQNELLESIDRNEISLNCSIEVLNKLIKKHGGKSEYDDFGKKIKLLTVCKEPFYFDELDGESSSVFFYSEKENKLIINKVIESSYQQIDMTEDFFKGLSKLTANDFKVSFINKDNYTLAFCIYSKGELKFVYDGVEEWEDPLYFEEVPYFLELAKQKGMKKKKNEDGDKCFDSEEIYDLIYEFRDNLFSGDTYLKLAPDWYLNMKSINN